MTINQKEHAQPDSADSGIFYGYVIVAAAAVIMMAAFGAHYAFGIFFKPILNEFGWSRMLVSGAFSISWLFHALSCLVMGRLNDRLGPRFVLTLSGIILSGGFLLSTGIDAVWKLYLFYGALVGIGTGGIFIPLVSTIARWFVLRRTIMTGIAVAGIGVGTLVMPLIASRLIAIFDWQTAYAVLGIAVLIIIVVGSLFLKRDPSKAGQLPFGHGQSRANPLQQDDAGFTLKEAAGTPQLWLVISAFLCFGFFTYAILVHISPHATDLGVSITTAANLVAAFGVASIFGKVVLGNIGDRIGNRNIFLLCFALVALSSIWVSGSRQTWVLYLYAMAIGIAYGGCSASFSPLVAVLFGLKSIGQIAGVANSGYAMGAMVGPLMAGILYDLTGSYRIFFYVIALVATIGFFLTLALNQHKLAIPVACHGDSERN